MKRYVLCGMLLGAVIVPCFSQEQPEPQIFSFKVGKIEVITLVENRRSGGVPSHLIGADQEMLDQYFADGVSQSQTNAFLVRNGKKNILIDTGFGTTLFDNLKSLGVSPEAVSAVLLTHMHGDHIGGLERDGKPLFPKATVYLAAAEKDYWTKTNVNQAAVNALNAYGKRVKTFNPAELEKKAKKLLAGIFPIAAFGHTPGHTLFMVESAKQKLLICADLLHVEKIQFARPDVSVTYDVDPVQAAQTRRTVLDYAASNRIPIAGMHLVYPSIGTVSADGAGFIFTAAE
jgi:glyoxylase-like metal-dependent hydrolase (beta-lactamase superfamily II)